jgi:hypothetical protein
MAELGDDGLAELGEDDVDGARRGAQLEQVSAVVASGGERTRPVVARKSGRSVRLVAGELGDGFLGAVVID